MDSGDLPIDLNVPCLEHGGAGTLAVLLAPPNAYDLIRS